MLAIEVEFLTGRYVASAHDDRQGHEWPPHPARLFSAIVAEWGNAEAPDLAERCILEALEGFEPPVLHASDAAERSVVTHYVPVNDPTVIGGGPDARAKRIDEEFAVLGDASTTPGQRVRAERAIKKLRDVTSVVNGRPNLSSPLPSERNHQARFYPSVTPADPVVTYTWPDAELDPDSIRTLDGLLDRVTRLGHSSSLVTCRLTDTPVAPSHVPDTNGPMALRTVSVGQLRALETEYARHEGSRPRSLPASVTRYSPVADATPGMGSVLVPSTAGELVVFEIGRGREGPRRRPGPQHIVGLTTALRDALMVHCEQPVPEIISGHREDGAVTTRPHVAFLALPDVGREHAHGNVLGVGVLLPKDVDPSERRTVLAAIGKWESQHPDQQPLTIAGGHRWLVSRLAHRAQLAGLRKQTWLGPSTTWASATPVALPWRRGRSRRVSEWDLADEWVVKACEHVGLPEPAEVAVSLTPALTGTLPASRYPTFRQGGTARRLVHVTLVFDTPVGGPFVLGSGRFRGLGLMRPVLDRRSEDE